MHFPPRACPYAAAGPRRGPRAARGGRWSAAVALLALAALCTAPARAQVNKLPDEFKKIDVVEHLGEQVPLDLPLRDDTGRAVTLGELLAPDRPTVLALAYYECPMLCTFVLNGIAGAVQESAFVPGADYRVITISIDPTEGPELAAPKRQSYLKSAPKAATRPEAWRFCTADQEAITRIAATVGFVYWYDAERDEYAHPAMLTVLTPDGRISRYLYGITYPARDFRLALVEASEGKIGTLGDKFLMFCYHYDPNTRGYALMAGKVMRLGGALTLVVMGAFLAVWWRRELRRRVAGQPPAAA